MGKLWAGEKKIDFLRKELAREQRSLLIEASKRRDESLKEKAKEFQRELRRRATLAEQTLGKVLANSVIVNDYEFQYIIYIKKKAKFGGKYIERFYIADFCFPKAKLIVELDGDYHYSPEQSQKDKERTRILKQQGYSILRISNERIFSAKEFNPLIEDLATRLNHEYKN